MRVAFILFDDLTALDLIGLYDPITRLRSMGFRPDLAWEFCAQRPEVHDDRGLRLTATLVGAPLSDFDVLAVPGGFGTRHLVTDVSFLAWLRTAEPVPLKAAVCTGSLLLGAAGWLTGLPATTHPNSLSELGAWCGEVRRDRVVDAGAVLTGGGVTSALDVGLAVVERLAGRTVREKIARQMDYPYRPEAVRADVAAVSRA
jgi:transcriptional regulator GlxA family with amidase domain